MKITYIFLCFVSINVLSQDISREVAEKYYDAEEWNLAIEAYQSLLKGNDSDSSLWFNLGTSQMKLGKYKEAQKSFDQAVQRYYSKVLTHYNKAKTFAFNGENLPMLKQLNLAAENGFSAYPRINAEKAFDPFRTTEAFKEVIERVTDNTHPCLKDANSRHFDFWIGEWDVMVNGVKVGENSITRAIGGCAIHENYVTERAYAGQSINYFDPIDEKWHQHWVGSSGDVYNYLEIDRAPGMLQFQSDFLFGGQRSLSKLTFKLLENGDVKQLFESSTDGGETWTNAFDGIYKRKEK